MRAEDVVDSLAADEFNSSSNPRFPGSKDASLAHGYQSIADIHHASFPLEKLDMVLSWIEHDLGLVDKIVIRSPEVTTNPRKTNG